MENGIEVPRSREARCNVQITILRLLTYLLTKVDLVMV